MKLYTPSLFQLTHTQLTLFPCADALLDAAAVTNVKEEEDAIEYDNEGEIEKRLSKLKGANRRDLILLENIPINIQCCGYSSEGKR